MDIKKTKLAVIGNPISHSLSPQMHNAAIANLGLNLQYSAVKVEEDNIKNFLDSSKKDYLGFNVTIPYKTEIIKYIDEISTDAKLSNSVNTVKFDKKGKSIGYSTDGYGLEMALKELFNVDIKNNSFLFIGCGGAAQATATHLLENKATSIAFLNRTVEKAENFASTLCSYFPEQEIHVSGYEDQHFITNYLNKCPIVIQSTSIGLNDLDPLLLPDSFFRGNVCYFDMIYKNTKFLEKARSKGAKTGNGLLMLLYQGVKSFEIWTDIKPPIDIMYNALQKSMQKV